MIHVGTSGWQYRDWRGGLYPAGLPQHRWLERYAAGFATVEVNNSFYRLPAGTTFAGWRARTPEDFRLAVKISRYLTHVRRLRDPAGPVARFLERATALGDRLGPVLLQLPPNLRVNPDALAATLRCFPREVRIAVEPRHRSWWSGRRGDEVRRVLERYGAAVCWADRAGRPRTPLWRTTDFGYLRMHEGRARPRPRYGRAALASWVERVAGYGDAPVFVYFNNDPGGAAVCDAVAFARVAAGRGLAVTRVPGVGATAGDTAGGTTPAG